MIPTRGKDLRWAPTHVARDIRASWSAFRGSKTMFDLMDDEFMEPQADEIKAHLQRMESDFGRIVELLTEGAAHQTQMRAEAKFRAQAKEQPKG